MCRCAIPAHSARFHLGTQCPFPSLVTRISQSDLLTSVRPRVRLQIGAYLVKALVQNAHFRPRGDEIARARQVYWAMVEHIDREHGDDVVVHDGGGDEWAFSLAESLPFGWADQLESEVEGDWLGESEAPLFAPSQLSAPDPADADADAGWPGDAGGGELRVGLAEAQMAPPARRSKYALDPLPTHKLFESRRLDAGGMDEWASECGDGGEGGGGGKGGGEGEELWKGLGGAEEARSERGPAAFCVYNRNGPSLREQLETPRSGVKGHLKTSYIAAHPLLYDTLVAGNLRGLRHSLDPQAKPMLVPPVAWSKPGPTQMPAGGQLHVATRFVRTESAQHEEIIRQAPQSSMQPMLDGLNAISRTEWRVNTRVLAIVEFMWEAYPKGLPFIPDCPSAVELPSLPSLPPPPEPEEEGGAVADDERAAHAEQTDELLARYRADLRSARQRQFNFHSQRISARLKLDVASEFAAERFYFPHNLDFRGRVYAVGPHLQYLGDDLARGLLCFARAKPLGVHGYYWLKVQLANLYGKDKLPLDERAAWTEEQMAAGRLEQIGRHPLEEASRDWWMAAEAPLQALQCIFELQAVADHLAAGGDAADFASSVPVHQDGSCNGLQHYAALGRDKVGAAQVNLVPADRPSDVYSGVTRLVQERVAATAAMLKTTEVDATGDPEAAAAVAELDDAAKLARNADIQSARLLDGLITRKVVKQTVMTSVYGVTRIGARDQILNRLKDINDVSGFERPMTLDELRRLAQFVAKLTFGSMGEVFSGATDAMSWLAEVATRISKDTDRPVVWVTPLGWPVLQPYFKFKERRVRTPFNVTIIRDPDQMDLLDDNSKAPVVKTKQRSAMPPNYVHSLDSSHMLMTATRCVAEGLTFAAVHDSFWTHAADVPRMNVILREAFVELHSATSLQQLHEDLIERFPDVQWDKLPPPPEQGDLDIECVKDSTYFFS